MPKVFEWKGCRFHFFSNEGDPLEPAHIHVQKGVHRAKFWIDPVVELASNYGFSGKELHEFKSKIEEKEHVIRSAWDEHFGS